jgi:hypothetical protein
MIYSGLMLTEWHGVCYYNKLHKIDGRIKKTSNLNPNWHRVRVHDPLRAYAY